MLSVGRDRSGLFEPAVQEYAERLTHYTRLTLVELPPSRKGHREGAVEEEADALLSALKPKEELVALDERGRTLDSRAFATQVLARAQGRAVDLAFAIGGDEGLSPRVLQRAALALSLSPMTLPHRLARLVLIEQLYRGFTILREEPYHK